MTIEQTTKQWLKMLAARVKRRTLVRYRGIIARHIYPHLDVTADIGDVSKGEIEALLKAAERRNATRNLTITVLKGVFAYAAERGWIAVDPMRAFKQNAVRRKPVEVFTEEEQRTLEAYATRHGDPACAVAMLCLYTGMRLGEAIAIRWSDVDETERTVSVCREIYRIRGECGMRVFVDTPKSAASRRTIPLCAKAWAIVAGLDRCGENIFGDGETMMPRRCQYAFIKMQRMSGIKVRNFHVLRHTFATRLLERGVDFKTLSELLGHENVAVTMRIYSHSLMTTKKAAVQLLDEV